MSSEVGYKFILHLAKDNLADENQREEALDALTAIGNESTIAELIELHGQPASISFKKAIVRTIGRITKRLQQEEKGNVPKHED